MTLLLKKLEIHGFKSFATPTTFVFDRGITAIVGPNGSGKSNVAEALRWVLGEQQYSNLRGRRTEDIIFSGSDRRSPLGMAEVVLTLDNSDGDLPLEFSEVVVARRAYRSGESQYLINGSRVRLKDVQQLTAPLGQAHTIIGQGLVDAVLSQRPEDRRGLFEHAAGIAGLRLRANDAGRSLAESAGNSQRLRDILLELEPRVRSLERSARQAREYGAVRDRLRALQRGYYAALWRDSSGRIAAATDALNQTGAALEHTEAIHMEQSSKLAGLRSQERQTTARQSGHAETLTTLERDLGTSRHRLELLSAESRATRARLADLETSQNELTIRKSNALDDATDLEREITRLESIILEQESDLAQHEAAAQRIHEERDQTEQQLRSLEHEILRLSRLIAEAEGGLQSFEYQRSSLETDQVTVQRQRSDLETRLSETLKAIDDLDSRRSSTQNQLAQANAVQDRSIATLESLKQRETVARQALENLSRNLAALRSSLELLQRNYESGEGLQSAVRTLVRAVRAGRLDLPGLRGTLASLIEVPGDYETAIEVALGGRLQDLVVEHWSDAERAIEFLKQERAGRATFQPLDTVRNPAKTELDLEDAGIVGIASQLITYPPDIAPVIGQALNRVLVVEDLATSRRIIRHSRNWTLVTLAGEITRPAGSITGGSAARAAGLLARERERRALPGRIADLERTASEHQDRLDAILEEIHEQQRASEAGQQQVGQLRAILHECDSQRERFERESAGTRQQVKTLEARLADSGAKLRALDLEQEQRKQQLSTWITERERAHAGRETLAAALAGFSQRTGNESATLRAELAAGRERLRSMHSSLQRSRRDIEQASLLISQRETETSRLEATLERIAGESALTEGEITRLEASITVEREALGPLARERENIAGQIALAERELDRTIGDVRDAERLRDRATLDLARCQDEQVFLRERIRNDLDLDDPASQLTDDGSADDDIEREINRLRERLRRMSAVGDDVLEEHATESERLRYLTEQLDDVEGAAESMRAVLAELNRKMASSFSETFQEVAAEFEQTFRRLFGGGTARLSQQNDDDEPGGVDIVAQPPGKRLQGLNQLSGGERALTAVALLVAIQRVNPSPFCLLDEVDAALDESNVVRFKDELRDLSDSTQFVVITHNRGTIEGADTLYGVTMGDDGVSRTVSLRLDEAIRAVEDHEAVVAAG